jgi:metallophosphoesterase (TIGR00282 family)
MPNESTSQVKVLFIGDIVGRPGRRALRELLPPLLNEYSPHFVLANGENASGGRGLTRDTANELFNLGIDFLTMGNHVWDNREILQFIGTESRLIRPANFPAGAPGAGHGFVRRHGFVLAVLNLQGRVFMAPLENPFAQASRLVGELLRETPLLLVDFHAEATSEKGALAWFLDGKASVVLGTHTHVQTADSRVLPQGTAFITDVGMTGPRNAILGVKKEIIINNFLTQLPARFDVAEGEVQLNAVYLELDAASGKAQRIEALQRFAS